MLVSEKMDGPLTQVSPQHQAEAKEAVLREAISVAAARGQLGFRDRNQPVLPHEERSQAIASSRGSCWGGAARARGDERGGLHGGGLGWRVCTLLG